MSASFACHRCDYPLQPAEGYEGQFVRCPKCGSYTSLPGAAQADGYACAEPFKSCPNCEQELPAQAILCTRCLFNFKTGRRVNVRRALKPFFRHWGGNVPLRLAIAGVLLLLCAPALLWVDRVGVVIALCAWPVLLLLAAGAFCTASLRRDRQGRCDLITRQWVCFVPLPARTCLLDRRCMSIESSLEGGGAAAWVEALLANSIRLRLFFAPVLVLIYLYAMVAVGKYAVMLADDRGSRVERTVIYRCRRESTMREIVDAFCDVARLSCS